MLRCAPYSVRAPVKLSNALVSSLLVPNTTGPSEFLKLILMSNGFFNIFFARHIIALPHGELNVLKSKRSAIPCVSTHSQLSTSD